MQWTGYTFLSSASAAIMPVSVAVHVDRNIGLSLIAGAGFEPATSGL